MKINTSCSFSCPRGYKLQDPSYKQCWANGQWTENAKLVSCKGELKITDDYNYNTSIGNVLHNSPFWKNTDNGSFRYGRMPCVRWQLNSQMCQDFSLQSKCFLLYNKKFPSWIRVADRSTFCRTRLSANDRPLIKHSCLFYFYCCNLKKHQEIHHLYSLISTSGHLTQALS